jgi:pimeloyl-ACP methyl ester carboxylesterase
MLRKRVNDYDMAYIEVGTGPPLVAIHGSLGDFRVWAPVMGPLSQQRRFIAPSLRHFFPEHWDGKGGRFKMDQHIDDVIAFIEALQLAPVDLLGHSRGGHIAFRVAERRPDLLRRLVLAEPGGELDDSLMPAGTPTATNAARASSVEEAAKLIAAGDIDGGLQLFVDRIDGPGTWAKRAAAVKQLRRDNARTLIGQIAEERRPFSRASAASIRVPTLLVGGARTPGMLPIVLKALAGAIPGAQTVMIPETTHVMFDQAPVTFSSHVLEFLA